MLTLTLSLSISKFAPSSRPNPSNNSTRRKSSQSSSIDAQTISTYDSNGDHNNGLYRNYQQAWENLRFAAPGSQPKSSGTGGGGGISLITAHVSTGPSVGLKNYAAPAAMLHPNHPMVGQLHGHRNLAMSNNSSASSSQSSSTLGGSGAAGSGGADPLLGHQQHHHGSHLHQHHQQQLDEDDEDEQGVISADEVANYHPHSHHHLHHDNNSNHHHHHHHHHHLQARHVAVSNQSEGFRDSNELTINADTATGGGGHGAVGRRLYSNNSIGRSVAATNRRSLGNMSTASGGQQANNLASSSQHQRLVSSSTSSTSTRSSRASPHSDEHSLDQLAYGNSWHQPGVSQDPASGRPNMRY